MPAVAYVSDQPATDVHDSLRSSLATADNAQQCAVLWLAEVKRRQLCRELDLSSTYLYTMHGQGGVPADWAELLLEALAALVEDRESDNTDSHAE